MKPRRARILAYEPPDRLVFSWDISPYWQLEHRNIDRQGPGWEGVHAGVDDEAGWTLYLDRYASLFAQ